MMNKRMLRYFIVVFCVIAILLALVKILAPTKKMNTYLWLSLKKWLNVKKKYVHIILHMFWSTVRVRCKVIFKF